MKRLTVVLLVLYMLVLVAALPGAVWAEDTPAATEALGPVIIPDDAIEISGFAGTSFPDGVLGGALSFKAAQTTSGRAIGYLDAGGTLSGGAVGAILGVSIKLAIWGDVKTRIGFGAWSPDVGRFRWDEVKPLVYTRLLAW